VYVGIGSNINKAHNLRSCVHTLQQIFRNIKKSSVYQSSAVGFNGDDFYNMVVRLETSLTPEYVSKVFFEIEKRHGRKRGKDQFVSRVLDLDLLLYDNLITDNNGLLLPHKDLMKHAFVLKPMQEIAGDLRHPKTGICFAELWEQCQQQALIKKISFSWAVD